jgi:hypothetical protein
MTQGELNDAIEAYNKALRKERDSVKNDKQLHDEVKTMINSFQHEEVVDAILAVEKFYREQYADLYPVEDEKEKTKEEKAKAVEDELKNWETNRREELKKEDKQVLVDRLVTLRTESLATVRASGVLNNYSLSVMVRNPETRERIFETADDVLRVKDKVILDKLLETLNEFNKYVSDKQVRTVAQSENFTQAGQSQEK